MTGNVTEHRSIHESKIETYKSAPRLRRGFAPPSRLAAADDPDALGEISFRNLSAAGVRNFDPNVFYCVRSRNDHATFVGRTGILVFFLRCGALVDRVYRAAATDLAFRVWSRAHARSLDLVNGRTRQSFPRRTGRRPRRHQPHQLLDLARAIYIPPLQHPRDHALWFAQRFLQLPPLPPLPFPRHC